MKLISVYDSESKNPIQCFQVSYDFKIIDIDVNSVNKPLSKNCKKTAFPHSYIN